ncbi:hypothetical protein A9HBioS_2423 [Pseudomonas koreensis]|uniref:Integrase n=2 Tax=Pseudomonas koreensis TaxID=198620 RepID=A0AA94JHZ2_9PSED|nr:hypothetical protein A9HBioS_2423 [Pseudomonas koreensis]
MPRFKSFNNDDLHMKMLLARSKGRYASTLDFEAHWLVGGGIGSSVWETISPNGTPLTVSFMDPLPDGTLLSDQENRMLLETIQKWAFYLRKGQITEYTMATPRWAYNLLFIKNIASWLVLHEKVYRPRIHGFRLFDTNAFKALVSELSECGLSGALQYKERIICHFHSLLEHPIPLDCLLDSPHDLDKKFVNDMVEWLRQHDKYITNRKSGVTSKWTLSRVYLGSILGMKLSATSSDDNFRSFIRQFEPGLYHPHLLLPSSSISEYPSQNIIELSKAREKPVSQGNFTDQLEHLANFFSGHSAIPSDIPAVIIDKKSVVAQFRHMLRRPSHTPLIPLSIGLQVINAACEWILVYGKSIVEAAIYYSKESVDISSTHDIYASGTAKQQSFLITRDQWLTTPLDGTPPVSIHSILDITHYDVKVNMSGSERIHNMRSVVKAFVGACAIIIGMMKPLRLSELAYLQRACLGNENDGDGSFLQHEQGKSGPKGEHNIVDRPIPSISARAIQLLQLMGHRLTEVFDDTSTHSEHLFYFPSRSFTVPSGEVLEDAVNNCINTFCDYIKTPVDELGRRWYPRVHEMRKFFMLTMHRHEGNVIKPLLGYGAAHKDKSHVDSYVAPDESYDTYVRYESECIEDRLLSLEAGALDPTHRQGLLALYQHTLTHFGVSSISSIIPKDYLDLIMEIRESGDFEVTTFTIKLTGYAENVTAIDFAIRFGAMTDERFNK